MRVIALFVLLCVRQKFDKRQENDLENDRHRLGVSTGTINWISLLLLLHNVARSARMNCA